MYTVVPDKLDKYLSRKSVLVQLYKMHWKLLERITDSFLYDEHFMTITLYILQK